MAKRSRLVFSHQHLNIEQGDGQRRDKEAVIQAYFPMGNRNSRRR